MQINLQAHRTSTWIHIKKQNEHAKLIFKGTFLSNSTLPQRL